MKNYLELLIEIMNLGTSNDNRTGVRAKSLIGKTLRFNNVNDFFPLITTRRIPFRLIFEETMFFLSGKTQTKYLENHNVNIWKGNTSRAFLDSRGLTHLEEGDMGKGYGHQIRNFGSTGYDQLKNLLIGLRNNPHDRRHVISHWCPSELADTALPPCHVMHMYSVSSDSDKKYLNSSFIMRSSDAFHGLPFNIASYALINVLISNCCGFTPGTLTYFAHDVHIYESHIDAVNHQLERCPKSLPILVINKNLYRDSIDDTLNELLSLSYEDVKLLHYDPYDSIKVEMVI